MLGKDGEDGGQDLRMYGLVIIVVNWLPGIVASMHVLHMYRTKLPAKKTISYTGEFKYQSYIGVT